MYRKIDKSKVMTTFDKEQVKRDALHYAKYRKIYAEIRQAYLDNRIDYEQLQELQGQVRAGDAEGAENGLREMVYANV